MILSRIHLRLLGLRLVSPFLVVTSCESGRVSSWCRIHRILSWQTPHDQLLTFQNRLRRFGRKKSFTILTRSTHFWYRFCESSLGYAYECGRKINSTLDQNCVWDIRLRMCIVDLHVTSHIRWLSVCDCWRSRHPIMFNSSLFIGGPLRTKAIDFPCNHVSCSSYPRSNLSRPDTDLLVTNNHRVPLHFPVSLPKRTRPCPAARLILFISLSHRCSKTSTPANLNTCSETEPNLTNLCFDHLRSCLLNTLHVITMWALCVHNSLFVILLFPCQFQSVEHVIRSMHQHSLCFRLAQLFTSILVLHSSDLDTGRTTD